MIQAVGDKVSCQSRQSRSCASLEWRLEKYSEVVHRGGSGTLEKKLGVCISKLYLCRRDAVGPYYVPGGDLPTSSGSQLCISDARRHDAEFSGKLPAIQESGCTSGQVRQKVLTNLSSRIYIACFSGFHSAQAEREDGTKAVEIEKNIAIRDPWLSQ